MQIPQNLIEFQKRAREWQQKAGVAATQIRPFVSVAGQKALTGVVVAIPLLATLWVVQLAYNAINNVSAPFLEQIGLRLPLLPFFVTLAVFITLGFMASNVLGRRVLEKLEAGLLRVPVVATVYAAVKQVIDSFKSFHNMENFKRVVYLDYPAPGARLIGFVTGQYYDSKLEEEMTTVVIPTSPNPMTGLVVAVPGRLLTESSLTLEEAMKMVVSAGLVAPKRRDAISIIPEAPCNEGSITR
ncbi:MAG: DUF502 domain-containing protein [Chthoniobacteraceae bacterium]